MERRTLLSACPLSLGGHPNANESVCRLELLHGLGRIVDEGKSGRLATAELCPQTEDGELVLVGLVHGRELLAKRLLGDVCSAGMEDVAVAEKDCQLSLNASSTSAIRSTRGHIDPARHRQLNRFREVDSNVEVDSHYHLLTAKQRIRDELSRPKRDGTVGVSHVCGLEFLSLMVERNVELVRLTV